MVCPFRQNRFLYDNAVEFIQSLAHPVVTTNYIVDETVTLAKNRLGYRVAIEIGEKLWNEEAASLIRDNLSRFETTCQG